MEDVGGAPWAVGLLDLGLAAGRVAQGVEQTAGVAPDTAWIGGPTAVEGDSHEPVIDCSREFAASPGNARKAT